MDAQKTKEYLKQVFDIEMALHTHKKLMEDFQTKRQKERPNTPEFSFYKKPEPPKRLHNETERKLCDFGLLNNEAIQIVVCFGIGGLFGLFFLIGFFTLMSEMGQGGSWVDGGQAKAFLLFLGLGLATAIPIFIGLKIWKRETDYIIQRDKNAYEKYTKDLAQYNQQYETSKKIYDDRLARTQSQIVTYDKVTNVETANLNGSLYKLEKSLKQLYDVNIIYPKYRNLIAIATIYEYFASGRCTELEGPNGAYNLYENELRANIIIGSLGQIISDLQQIKNGQFALYQELQNSNREITRLLYNISDNTQMTSYHAKVAAAAASADRYIVGMVW